MAQVGVVNHSIRPDGTNFIASAAQKVGSFLGWYVIPGSQKHIETAITQLRCAVRLQDKPQAQKEYAKAMILRGLLQDEVRYPEYELAHMNFIMANRSLLRLSGAKFFPQSVGSAKRNTTFMSSQEWVAAVKQAALELGQETYLNSGLKLESAAQRITHLASIYAYPEVSKKKNLAEQKQFCERVLADSKLLKDNPGLNTKLTQLIQQNLMPKTGIMYRGLQLLGAAIMIAAAYDGFHYYKAGKTPILSYARDLLDSIAVAVGKTLQKRCKQNDYCTRMLGVVQGWIQPMCRLQEEDSFTGYPNCDEVIICGEMKNTRSSASNGSSEQACSVNCAACPELIWGNRDWIHGKKSPNSADDKILLCRVN